MCHLGKGDSANWSEYKLQIKLASYVCNVVRNSKGLPVIIALLEANHDPVIRAATTALRKLAVLTGP